MRRAILCGIALTALLTMATAADAASKVSGIAFGDYYWFAANHDPSVEDQNGLWMRRIYLTYDLDKGDDVSMRFRLESGSPGVGGAGKMEPFAKDAYLKWTPGGGDRSWYIGLSGSPTFTGVEKAWGYRHVEKTPVDLYKLGSTRDFGVAVKGNLSEQIDYHVMIGNGNSTGAENNKGKKYMASAGLALTDNMTVRGSFDFDDQAGEATFMTAQVLLLQKAEGLRWGLQYVLNNQDNGTTDQTVNVASGYVVFDVNEGTSVLARVDALLDENPKVGGGYLPLVNTSKHYFILAGVDFSPEENFHIIPNAEIVVYDQSGVDTDIVPRVTFSYKF